VVQPETIFKSEQIWNGGRAQWEFCRAGTADPAGKRRPLAKSMAAEQFRGRISFGGLRRRTGAGSVSVALARTSVLPRQYRYKAIDENLLHYALNPAEVRQKFTTSSFLKSDNRF
jgi:hypothetical protein